MNIRAESAFNFKHAFDAHGNPIKLDRERIRQKAGKLPQIDYRKLRMLNDLRIPPANRLEKLKGDREGQYSTRINAQWRICFEWLDGDA